MYTSAVAKIERTMSFNPIQARLFLPFKGPRVSPKDPPPPPLMILGSIKASPMKLCTVIVLLKA